MSERPPIALQPEPPDERRPGGESSSSGDPGLARAAGMGDAFAAGREFPRDSSTHHRFQDHSSDPTNREDRQEGRRLPSSARGGPGGSGHRRGIDRGVRDDDDIRRSNLRRAFAAWLRERLRERESFDRRDQRSSIRQLLAITDPRIELWGEPDTRRGPIVEFVTYEYTGDASYTRTRALVPAHPIRDTIAEIVVRPVAHADANGDAQQQPDPNDQPDAEPVSQPATDPDRDDPSDPYAEPGAYGYPDPDRVAQRDSDADPDTYAST